MRCFDIYFYSLSTARFYCLPTFFCPIIKESKLFQSCIRMKDPMGYIASLLCQKFKDHVWSFSIDVIYLLSLTLSDTLQIKFYTCFISIIWILKTFPSSGQFHVYYGEFNLLTSLQPTMLLTLKQPASSSTQAITLGL